jgi:hypothetical protein
MADTFVEEALRKLERQLRPNGPDRNSPDRFKPEPWVYRDPTTMPTRPWVLGTTFIRGYATAFGAAGGVGKTSRGIASALAVVTGRHDITGEHVFQRGKAWIITLEDNRLEMERRIAACMLANEINPEQVAGGLFLNDMSGKPPVLIETDESGNPRPTLDVAAIIEVIRAHDILLPWIDPLIKAHRGIENRNEHMDLLITQANRIANETDTSVGLSTHFRKGPSEGASESFRGGGALIDGARIARTLIPMTEEDAKALNVTPADRQSIIREQNPKANMAKREAAVWFELVDVSLGNVGVDPRYPKGDRVQALKPWKPPAMFEGVSLPAIARIFDRLRTQPDVGWWYSLHPRAKYRAATVVAEEVGATLTRAKDILQAWKRNNVIGEEEYLNPNRDEASRVTLNEGLIGQILASLVRGEI